MRKTLATTSLAAPSLGRRAFVTSVAAGLALPVRRARAAGLPELRLGVLQFGTLQWVADVIKRHRLDEDNGFVLTSVPLANIDAGRIAMMAGQADVILSDWPFVASQRGAGTNLCFSGFSTSSGGVMTSQASPIHTLADLRDRRLGIVGGPVDKSWLVVQAAARAHDKIDLVKQAQIVYGAPPLLSAKLEQGELDAVLTFWNFAAKLEAAGYREAISVSDCAVTLGLPAQLSLVGYVFREDWAKAPTSPIDGFLMASTSAQEILTHSENEWLAIRPLMQAPDGALFHRLRERFIAGVAHADVATREHDAAHLFDIMIQTGGTRATGGLDSLPPGIFWHATHGAG